ncbi:MAG: penicillin-binding protein 1A [Burkholderiaceae bacterium]|nr:penicillin-binding protein 1A [Burkholderiaceae bacterium]
MPSKPTPHERQSARPKLPFWSRATGLLIGVPVGLALAGALAVSIAILLANDRLPPLDALTDYRPKVPLRVYTADGQLIGEFGEERRSVVRIADVPALMKNAVLAAEDARFFEHGGIDFKGIARAAVSNLVSGGRDQGASTITQQLAKNFYLSSEKTYTRKIYEALLALRIEENLTKDQILEIYMNQIFLGKRAHGFASAAQIYFGKTLNQLSPAEAAMLAGLPKAPSLFNPLVNPKRATERQHYILQRMHEIGSLTDQEYETALKQPLRYSTPGNDMSAQAPYVAEMARMMAYELFKEDIYTAGLNVYTTIRSAEQRVATAAVRQGVIDYDRKYGYRGPEQFLELPADPAKADAAIEDALEDNPDIDEFQSAVVLDIEPRRVRVSRGHGQVIDITGDGLKFAASALSERAPAGKRLRRGALVRILPAKGAFEIGQLPEVQAALVACNSQDGSVRALVGGFDFSRNKFNRVTQAWRQPGSSFKPFIYSASLEKGFMASTLINDAPFSVDAAITGGQVWEPKNYDGKFDGPMRMRQALAKSKNMVSIRILQSIGPRYAQDYITRFGFDEDKHPAYLTMALGAGSVTPWQMAGAYSVFANGGYRVEPYIVARITDANGKLLAQARPLKAGDENNRAIDGRNAFIMDSLLRGVVRNGTAAKAMALKRTDLAGKTGTTNDSHDAWFAGYSPGITAIAWVGFDQPHKLGERETGGGLALPIWMAYMGRALAGVPEQPVVMPDGVVDVGGEFYFAETRPGQGVSSVGLNEERPATTDAPVDAESPLPPRGEEASSGQR